ncbi:hypothetical protein R1sor_022884 [Riccia sorocarpa]|uniref:J domain-containing protein n=1 Tax=Riccia sorocarpa TaxID=122646 RepID=A0ABD3GLW4_9MARC
MSIQCYELGVYRVARFMLEDTKSPVSYSYRHTGYRGMECNKEEALHAKEVAETRFQEGDFTGAKRLLTKAIRLAPSLEGLAIMLPIIDTHIVSTQTLPNGEMDWYKILQVEPDAGEAVIRSQYKKLALQFHPDKNQAVGAESAFKLICDAWNVLSDNSKKLQHDSNRSSVRASPVKASSTQVEPQHSQQQNLHYESDALNDVWSEWEQVLEKRVEEQKKEAEKRRKLEEEKLTREAEDVKTDGGGETNLPTKPENVGSENEMKKEEETKAKGKGKGKEKEASSDKAKGRKKAQKVKPESTKSKFKIIDNTADITPERANGEQLKEDSKALSPVQEQTISRRTRSSTRQVHIPDVPERTLAVDAEQTEENVGAGASRGLDTPKQIGKRKISFSDDEVGPNAEVNRTVTVMYKTISLHRRFPSFRLWIFYENGTQLLSRNLFRDIVMVEEETSFQSLYTARIIRKDEPNLKFVVQEAKRPSSVAENKRKILTSEPLTPRTRSKTVLKTSPKTPNPTPPACGSPVESSTRLTRSMLRGKGKQVAGSLEAVGIQNDNVKVDRKKAFSPEAHDQLQYRDPDIINVVTPQFCDFDPVRARKHLKAGQIWAAYDEKDGMPRFYCRLIRVSKSSVAFRATLTWLEPTAKTEDRYLSVWAQDSSFTAACGEFEAGDSAETAHLNIFSHCIYENVKDPVTIYPLKSEIWALYKDWDVRLAGNMNLQATSASSEFELVEVSEEYSEPRGVVVLRLIQIPGFQTIFCRQGSDAVIEFSPSQLQCFSHRVLGQKVPNPASHGVPDEAWELDPAALPDSMLGN